MSEGKVAEVLEGAERQLLELIADAAAKGDYKTIDLARTAAEQVRALASRLLPEDGSPPSDAPPRSVIRREKSSTRSKSKASRTKKERYPKFDVTEEGLVKIGWSKKKGTEYTQRIPREAFAQVVAALDALASNGAGGVSSDVILQKVDDSSSEHIPSYQTYGVLRFLREQDIVKQIRRGEYSLAEGVGRMARQAYKIREAERYG